MASPQTEDGFTRIANELLEAVLRADLSKRQLRVVLAIMRQTYGYNRHDDDISGSRLSELTGIHRQHCNRSLQELAAMRVIDRTAGRYGTRVRLLKDYELWRIGDTKMVSACHQNGVTESNQVTPKQCQVDTESVSDRHQNGVGSDTKTVHTKDSKDNSKDTYKDRCANALEQRFDAWWQHYPKKRNRGQALKAWNAIKPDERLGAQMISATEIAKRSPDWTKANGKYIPYPATWLRAQGWLDRFDIEIDLPVAQGEACAETIENLNQLFGGEHEGKDIRRTNGVFIGSL